MTMKYNYTVEAKVMGVWEQCPYKSITIDEGVVWDPAPTATVTLSNVRGVSRLLCDAGRKVKITRNGDLVFFGMVTNVKNGVKGKGELSRYTIIEATDYYHMLLKKKGTGEALVWNYENIKPSDLAKSLIGTLFIAQDKMENQQRIATMTDTALEDGRVVLVKDASGYKTTGTVQSIPLQNGDRDTMGAIASASVKIRPSAMYLNKAPNPGFESQMDLSTTDWHDAGGWTYLSSQTSFSMSRSTTTPMTGTYCLRMVTDAKAGSDYHGLQMRNPVRAEPGQIWNISSYIKGTGTVEILVYYWTGSGWLTDSTTQAATGSWTPITFNKTLPSNTTWVTCAIAVNDCSAANDFYVDDVYFGRVPADGDIAITLARDGGSAFNVVTPIAYDTTEEAWTGTLASFDDELIANGDCESAEPTLDGTGTDVYVTSALSAGAHGGVKSLKLTTSGSHDWYAYDLGSLGLNGLIPGESYTFGVWVFIPSGIGITPSNVNIQFIDYDGSTWETEYDVCSTTDTWEYLAVTKTIRSAATQAYLRVQLAQNIPSGVVDIYVDDLSLECATKNKLAYKLTLNRESATSAPEVDTVEIYAVTASDTGVIEGTISEYTAPAGDDYSSLISMDLGDKKGGRWEGVRDVLKITGMEAYIDLTTGALSFVEERGVDSGVTLTVGPDITDLEDETDLEQMANCLTFIGSGEISDNVTFTHRVNLEDATSIATMAAITGENGEFEKIIAEKNIVKPETCNDRGYKALQDIKAAPYKANAVLVDVRHPGWSLGDTLTVNDPTGSTACIAMSTRATKMTRTYDGAERVAVEFSNTKLNSDSRALFQRYMDSVSAYSGTHQPSSDPSTYLYQGNISNAVPGCHDFYIDEGRNVVAIELTCTSQKYLDCQDTTIVEFGYYAPCQLSISGDHDVSPVVYNPAFGVRGDENNPFIVKRLDLMNYYASDGVKAIRNGWNKLWFVPSTSANNANGLLKINAVIKVVYKA